MTRQRSVVDTTQNDQKNSDFPLRTLCERANNVRTVEDKFGPIVPYFTIYHLEIAREDESILQHFNMGIRGINLDSVFVRWHSLKFTRMSDLIKR